MHDASSQDRLQRFPSVALQIEAGGRATIVNPGEEYAHRLRAREAQVDQHERLHVRLSNLRLGVFVVGVVIAWSSLYLDAFSARWLLAPFAVFVAIAIHHGRVRRSRLRAERAGAFYKRGLARIEDRWIGQGQSGDRFHDPHHVYSADLDLFGTGSVFELLSTARTRMGENALARWLLAPASLTEIRERQIGISELRELLDFREDLALLGEDAEVGVHPEPLLKWAEASNQLSQAWLLPVAALLPVLLICAAVVWDIWGLASPFVLILLVEVGVTRALGGRLREVLSGAENAFDDLKLLAALLARVECEPFRTKALQALIHRLSSHDLPASRTIDQLSTIVQLIESRRNPILAVLDLPLMYSVQLALAAERWRNRHGCAVRAWLEALGEIEALISLASYSYEHPDDPLPEFIDGPATFDGIALGHPLIPNATCVRNDVSIAGATRVLLISGSNMSGKSTLLRTIGVNTVLAMAGAPVRAQYLRLTPLQVGASIRINDSLHEGSSRFYAEITRLRQLLTLGAGSAPLLFLLDEMLQGTNSRDRRVGAEGVVQAYLEQGGVGLISTHDLALSDIDSAAGDRLRNMHFQDELLDGRMTFDFKLREGIVTKSNGIELMRAIGLKVGRPEADGTATRRDL
ncbi:MAG: MutS-related protein [Steroidobacter sp.]